MREEIRNHKIAYPVLVVVLLAFVLAFMYAWPDRAQQRLIVIAMSTFYFLWGVLVHKVSNHINTKVVFEYLAISILAASLLLLLLK